MKEVLVLADLAELLNYYRDCLISGLGSFQFKPLIIKLSPDFQIKLTKLRDRKGLRRGFVMERNLSFTPKVFALGN